MGKKAVSEEVRWQIVAHLNEGVKNNKEIAQLLGVSDKCVRTTKKNLELVGSPKELPRSGRPSKLTKKDKSCLFREVRREPTISLRNLAHQFSELAQQVSVNKDTVRKALKEKGIGSYTKLHRHQVGQVPHHQREPSPGGHTTRVAGSSS